MVTKYNSGGVGRHGAVSQLGAHYFLCTVSNKSAVLSYSFHQVCGAEMHLHVAARAFSDGHAGIVSEAKLGAGEDGVYCSVIGWVVDSGRRVIWKCIFMESTSVQ